MRDNQLRMLMLWIVPSSRCLSKFLLILCEQINEITELPKSCSPVGPRVPHGPPGHIDSAKGLSGN